MRIYTGIYIGRPQCDGFEPVLDRFARHAGSIFLSALSLAELHRGIRKPSEHSTLRRARLRELLQGVVVVPFDAEAAEAYGDAIAIIGWSRGKEMDCLIAAHALATKSILVTANTSDLAAVPGLMLENWTLVV